MGFLDRLKGLLADEEKPRTEDPQRAINRLVRELRRRVSDGKSRLAGASRDYRKLDRECLRLNNEVAAQINQAKKHLGLGDEAAARRSLSGKARSQALLQEMMHERERQKRALGILRESLVELASKVRAVEVRQKALRTRVRRTRALAARQKAVDDGKMVGAENLLADLSTRLEVEEELLLAGSAGDSLERRFAELEASGDFPLEQLEDLRGQAED